MKTLSNLRREVSEAKKMKGEDPCWTGYKMLGTKNKGGKQVPNCIPEEVVEEEKPGLWANIHAKRKRIAAGSGERMRKPGSEGAPTADALRKSATEEVEPIDEISTDGYYTAAAKSRMNAAVKVASSMGQDKQAKTKLDARNRGMKRVEKRTQDDMKKANSGPQRPRPEKKVSDAEARGYGQDRYMGDSYEPSNSTQIYEKNKDAGEYDYEGDMSKSQLRSIIANAQQIHDMLEDNTNMAEWVQSKITLAADYISTVADYMQGEVKEEAEQTDESRKSYYINSRSRKDPAVALARKQRRNFRNPPMVRGKNVNLENVSEALSARDRLVMAMNREKKKREDHEAAQAARESAKKLAQQTAAPEQKIKEGIASLISNNIKKVTATKPTPQQKANIRLNK